MARIGISYEQVAAAAQALVNENQRPTIEAIRYRLGTGSPNTIQRFLAVWRSASPAIPVIVPELPASILAAISAEIERAAAIAKTEIEALLQEARHEARELAETGEILETQIHSLNDELAAAKTALQEQKTLTDNQAWEISSLRQQLGSESVKNEKLRVELAKATVAVETLSAQQLKDAEMLVDLRQKLAGYANQSQESEKKAAWASAELAGLQNQLVYANSHIQKTDAQLLSLKNVNENQTFRVTELEKALMGAEYQIKNLQFTLDAAVKQAEQVQAEAKDSREQAKTAELQAAELKGQLKILQHSLFETAQADTTKN